MILNFKIVVPFSCREGFDFIGISAKPGLRGMKFKQMGKFIIISDILKFFPMKEIHHVTMFRSE